MRCIRISSFFFLKKRKADPFLALQLRLRFPALQKLFTPSAQNFRTGAFVKLSFFRLPVFPPLFDICIIKRVLLMRAGLRDLRHLFLHLIRKREPCCLITLLTLIYLLH
jgi:hypothetical protein